MQHERFPSPARELVVGCWPGKSFQWNSFAKVFAESLEGAGFRTVDIEDPRRIAEPIDVLHIHWPDQIFWGGTDNLRAAWRIRSTLHALKRLHGNGVPIVWMVHNLKPHEMSAIRRMLWLWLSRGVTRLADGFMTLCPATVPVVRRAFPRLAPKPGCFAWHPAYPRLEGLPDKAACRAELGIGEGKWLTSFLGLIRPYKGVEDLIASFRAKAPLSARLFVAGHCETPALADELGALARGDERIRLSLERLSEEAFAKRLIAADAVALPYRGYLHSGSIVHALSYARPVVTPAAPFADALADLVGPQWVRTYEGGLPDDAFAPFAVDEASLDMAMLDPANVGMAARQLYKRLLRQRAAFSRAEGEVPSANASAIR